MGYDSVVSIRAQKTRVETGEGRSTVVTALFLEVADSNLRDDHGRMARSWNLIRPGLDWEVMMRLVEYAANCESGMLRYRGRQARAETLIRAARKAVEEAPTVARFDAPGAPMTVHSFGVFQDKETRPEIYQREIEAAEEAGVLERCSASGRDYLVFPGSPEGLAAYLELEGLATGKFAAYNWRPCRAKKAAA